VRDRVGRCCATCREDADPPVVSKVDNDSEPVLTWRWSASVRIRELTELADKLVRLRLERAAASARCAGAGGTSAR
jgi:HAE1 family hydrophobic/amphiphilic exporter-1